MAKELIYTSVPKGLKPGSEGFCTVAYTNSMSPNMVRLLESYSNYLFLPLETLSSTPVSFRHYKTKVDARTVDILTRIAYHEHDYSGRTNKFAHHLVLEKDEICPAGPAWLCLHDNPVIFRFKWEGNPRLIKEKECLIPSSSDVLSVPPPTWRKLTAINGGEAEAGWAGKLAQSFIDNPKMSSYIVYDLGMRDDILLLIREALQLLTPAQRWEVTFNTYYNGVANADCLWRCCLPDSPGLARARNRPGVLLIDLTKPLPALEDESPLVAAAREGRMAEIVENAKDHLGDEESEKHSPRYQTSEISIFAEGGDDEERDGSGAESSVEDGIVDTVVIGTSSSMIDNPQHSTAATAAKKQTKGNLRVRADGSSRTVGKAGHSTEPPRTKPIVLWLFSFLILVAVGAAIWIISDVVGEKSGNGVALNEPLESTTSETEKNVNGKNAFAENGNANSTRRTPGGKNLQPEHSSVSEGTKQDGNDKMPTPRKNASGNSTRKSPETTKTLPNNKHNATPPPKTSGFWFPFQKAVRKLSPNSVDSTDISLPSGVVVAGGGESLRIVLRKSSKAKIVNEDGAVIVKIIKYNTLETKIISEKKACEFSLMDGKLRVRILEPPPNFTIRKNVKSIKIGNTALPTNYDGEDTLKAGIGKFDMPPSKNVLRFKYSFTERDICSGIFSQSKSFDITPESDGKPFKSKCEIEKSAEHIEWIVDMITCVPELKRLLNSRKKKLKSLGNKITSDVKKAKLTSTKSKRSLEIPNLKCLQTTLLDHKELAKARKKANDGENENGVTKRDAFTPILKIQEKLSEADEILKDLPEDGKAKGLKQKLETRIKRFRGALDRIMENMKKGHARLVLPTPIQIPRQKIAPIAWRKNKKVKQLIDVLKKINKLVAKLDLAIINKSFKMITIVPKLRDQLLGNIDKYIEIKSRPLFDPHGNTTADQAVLSAMKRFSRGFSVIVKRRSDGKQVKSITFKKQ